MTDLEAAIRAIAEQLDGRGVGWAIVGGIAVGSRSEPRTTRDVDVVVALDDTHAERLVADLSAAGFELGTVLEHESLDRIATVRMVARTGASVVIDLLFSSSAIEDFIVDGAERLEVVQGLIAPIARTGDLIALKLLARDDRTRPQDADDLRMLLYHADATEIDRARTAVDLIEQRGGNRGRNLAAALQELLQGS